MRSRKGQMATAALAALALLSSGCGIDETHEPSASSAPASQAEEPALCSSAVPLLQGFDLDPSLGGWWYVGSSVSPDFDRARQAVDEIKENGVAAAEVEAFDAALAEAENIFKAKSTSGCSARLRAGISQSLT